MSDLSGSLLHRIENISRSHMIFNTKQITDDANFDYSDHMPKTMSLVSTFPLTLWDNDISVMQ